MADIAPAPAPVPVSPAPAAHEVVVDQNPINSSAPMGAQAPPRPAGEITSHGRPESRREAIARAFAKSREGVELPPAKARIGHNQPPEPIEKAKPTASPKAEKSESKAASNSANEAPFNLRQRPVERGEHGHFAPSGRQDAQSAGQRQSAPPQQRQANPLPAADPYREPLRRMSQAAKAEWPAAPASVREDVHRMSREFVNFHQRAKATHAAFAPIKPYYDLARSHGTTLEHALSNYVGMENKLRSDPIGGLDVLVRNMNLRTANGQQITLQDIAHYVLSRTPEQHALTQTGNVTSAHNAQISQLTQQVTQLTAALQHMHNQQQYRQRYNQTKRGVDRFAETHPRIDEPGFGDVVVQELRAGHNLEQAYQRAQLLRPSGGTAQTRPTGAAAQTRTVDRSISGAPSAAPSSGKAQRRAGSKPASRRDIIADAIRKTNGSL